MAVFNGTPDDDVLTGTADIDVLTGLDGDDRLIGLGAADLLRGGAGTDTADYTASPAGVEVDLAAGTGTGGDAEGDRLSGIENVVGSRLNDSLLGSAEGWDPEQWREVVDNLARLMSWKAPDIPAAGDPRPYEGAPAL